MWRPRCRCGKVPYERRRDAMAVADNHDWRAYRAYFDPLCQTWHLTSEPLLPSSRPPSPAYQ